MYQNKGKNLVAGVALLIVLVLIVASNLVSNFKEGCIEKGGHYNGSLCISKGKKNAAK